MGLACHPPGWECWTTPRPEGRDTSRWGITVHAVFISVRIDPARHDEAVNTHLRESVVPTVKGAPGFVRRTWFGDTTTGYGVAVFQSEQQAQQMASMVTTSPHDPVQIEDVKVYPVTAEA